MVEDAVDLRKSRVPLLFRQSRLLGVVRQVEPRLLHVVVVEVELGHDDLVEALELGAVREVGLLLFFFLGLLLGFGRFLVVGPTRALATGRFEDAATRFAMVTPRTRPALVQNIESSARRVTEM